MRERGGREGEREGESQRDRANDSATVVVDDYGHQSERAAWVAEPKIDPGGSRALVPLPCFLSA